MANTNALSTSINYTSRDFYSLRDDLITRVQNRVNTQGKVWNANDPADFGIAIVEAFAHVGDITNYYIDRVANEQFLSTAVQRSSIINLAAEYGYKPSGYKRAYLDVQVANSKATDLTLPSGTVLSTSVVLVTSGNSTTIVSYFTVEDDVVIAGTGSTATTLRHGRQISSLPENLADTNDAFDIAGELLGYSNGYGNQTFTLKYNQVVDDSVNVYVRNGDTFTIWNQVDNINEYSSGDFVYALSIDANNYVSIIFGDGISGAIPVYGDEIKVDYVYGGGLEGNININNQSTKTFSIISVPNASGVLKTDLTPYLTIVYSTSGYGGEDPESNSSIRRNAPLAFRTVERAVSLQDFKNLALVVPGVGKATAYASNAALVNLYIAPTVSDSSADYYPGYLSNNSTISPAWYILKNDVATYFSGKTQIGTTISILPPTYIPVDLVLEYVKLNGYTDAQVIADFKTAVLFGNGFNYLDFDTTIRPEKLEQNLSTVNGIDSVRIVKLFRHGGSSARSTLVPANGEYFVFTDGNTSVYPIASLSNLSVTIGNGTMPTFYALTKTYAFTSTSTSMTFTPTTVNSVATVAYVFTNGSGTVGSSTAITSGAASASLTLTTGVNTIAVTVTSADSVNTNTYYIKVTK
jgi:hypothetical protein